MSQSLVSVIITSYHAKAKPYLDLCVKSVLNLNWPRELLEVLIVAPRGYKPQYEGAKTISPPEESYGMPRGLNFGMQSSLGEYMLVLNDDVILTRNCLGKLVAATGSYLGLLMPIGNDQQGRYHIPLPIVGPYKIEQAECNLPDMLNSESPCGTGYIFSDTLCLYAFLISRKAYELIGPFDEGLIGQDDIDYSLRSRREGYFNAIALDALVWHAGGASNTLTDEQRQESMRRFNQKWGQV